MTRVQHADRARGIKHSRNLHILLERCVAHYIILGVVLAVVCKLLH